jgi:asparagine synthase (glutamine-hydrolysing)
MCGIWASVGTNYSGDGLAWVAHRGPDGGATLDLKTGVGPLSLGHRRLAIYDTSEDGIQPMQRGTLTVCFNGAIYNFLALRAQLQAQGQTFTSQSDTEVLLAAWDAWGPSCLAQLEGMFAFVLYDARIQKLYAVRDRYGEKPLHFISPGQGSSHHGGGLAFASEIGQFHAEGRTQGRIQVATVRRFLDFGLAETGSQTFWAGIARVLPGHLLEVDLHTDRILVGEQKCWLPTATAQTQEAFSNVEQASERLIDALKRSVNLRLAADVVVGSCLSGGLDSSSIVRIAKTLRTSNQPLLCFSAIFDEKDAEGTSLSEAHFARLAANQNGLELVEICPTDGEVTQAIETITRHQGEPFATASICAQHFVFKAARESGVKVMLDGQGADEILGGYQGAIGPYLVDTLTKRGPIAWSQAAAALGEVQGFSRQLLISATYNAAVPEAVRRGIARLRGRWPAPWKVTMDEMEILSDPQEKSCLSAHLAGLQEQFSLPSLLRYEDRNAMAFGIETRLPFLAPDVVNIGRRLSGAELFNGGWSKSVLRRAMRDLVPDEILRRRNKFGFVAPQTRWMAGPLATWVNDGLHYAQTHLASICNQERMVALRADTPNSPSTSKAEFEAVKFRLASVGQWMATNNLTL